MAKVITIGSATVDVFVECDEANIVSVCTKDHNRDFMSYPYGSKIDISEFSSRVGGGGVNTACNFANLGFDTSAIFKIGEDIYSEGILHFFKGDRTVLAHRGANAKIREDEIDFDAVKDADFIYVAPLNGESNSVIEPLVDFAHKHDLAICFNAGTTSLKKGRKHLDKILRYAHVVVMNKEEAIMATGIQVRPDTKTERFSKELVHPDIKAMLRELKVQEYQVIVITDGNKGAYAWDGKKYYFCPTFPSDVVSTLGAGDAFASTFCGALKRTDINVGLSLMYGSVNSASVVSEFGATDGLLTFEEIEEKLKNNPDYTYLEC